jgi:transcription elongation factor GreA
MAKVRLTAEGRERLTAELEHLTHVRRHEITERIVQAREEAHGDSGDSTAYEEAKAELVLLETRIAELERTLAEVEVVDEVAGHHSEVGLGAHVTVRDDAGTEEQYVIVDHAEADPRHGRISDTSPVGKALVGHKVNDVVEVETPAGSRRLTITTVS